VLAGALILLAGPGEPAVAQDTRDTLATAQPADLFGPDDERYVQDMDAAMRVTSLRVSTEIEALGDTPISPEVAWHLAGQIFDVRDQVAAIPPTPRFAAEHADLVRPQGAFAAALEQLAQALNAGDPAAESAADATLEQSAQDLLAAAHRWAARAQG
jgi:hypothetical protein